jgi:hypothetical protein
MFEDGLQQLWYAIFSCLSRFFFCYLNIILNKCTLYVKHVYILFNLSIGHDYKLGL